MPTDPCNDRNLQLYILNDKPYFKMVSSYLFISASKHNKKFYFLNTDSYLKQHQIYINQCFYAEFSLSVSEPHKTIGYKPGQVAYLHTYYCLSPCILRDNLRHICRKMDKYTSICSQEYNGHKTHLRNLLESLYEKKSFVSAGK